MRLEKTMVTTTGSSIGGRPPPKRPVYRSEFVIRLQTMREQKGIARKFHFDLLDEPIDWRTPSVPVRTNTASVRKSYSKDLSNRSSSQLSRICVKDTLKRPAVIFNEFVDIYEVEDYDRKVDKSWTRLTQIEKLKIRCELNNFKTSEMIIHRDSRQHTRLHRI